MPLAILALAVPLLADASALKLILVIAIVLVVFVAATHHGLIILFAHIFHPHILGFFAAAALMLFLLLALFGVHRAPQAMMNIAQPPAAPQPIQPPREVIAVAKISAPKHENEIVKEKSSPAGEGEKKPAADSTSAPSWINDEPHKERDSFIAIVHLEPNTNPAVRDEMLDEKMKLAASEYVDEHLYPTENVSKIVTPDAEYLRSHCLREMYPASSIVPRGTDVYARLEFDRKFRDEVEHRYRQIVSWEHLELLGKYSIAGLALLGGLYTFLRLTPRSPSGTGPSDPRSGDPSLEAAAADDAPAKVERHSMYASVRTQARAHPWRFVLGCAVGGGIGALIVALIAH